MSRSRRRWKRRKLANNTVWCEYYRPHPPGKKPGVIVLHILGGDFELSRLFCNYLAQHGVCALFVKMPYYGERRDPASPRRMVSHDPQETVAGMTQAVLDIRRATAWLGARPEVDDAKLGIFGISLGGITSSLAATAEPRLQNVCLLLAGGDVGRVAWESLELRGLREKLLAKGVNREQFVETLSAVDPVTYAASCSRQTNAHAQRPRRRSDPAGLYRVALEGSGRARHPLVFRRPLFLPSATSRSALASRGNFFRG